MEVKKEELAALKQELDAKTAELNETRGMEIEMRNRLEENQKVLAENQKRLKYWNEKLGKLTMQNVRYEQIGTTTRRYADKETATLESNMLRKSYLSTQPMSSQTWTRRLSRAK